MLEIKRLLYEKRFTIAGARKVLASQKPERAATRPAPVRVQGELFANSSALLTDLRRELGEILRLLDHSPADK